MSHGLNGTRRESPVLKGFLKYEAGHGISADKSPIILKTLAIPAGFEPATHGVEIRYSLVENGQRMVFLPVRAPLKIPFAVQSAVLARTFSQAVEIPRLCYFFFPHQPSLAKREKAAAPKPNGRRRAVAASYGSASQPPELSHLGLTYFCALKNAVSLAACATIPEPALDRTCRFPWFGVAGCRGKDPSGMLRLTVSHDQEQSRRLNGSAAWYGGVRADYKGAK